MTEHREPDPIDVQTLRRIAVIDTSLVELRREVREISQRQPGAGTIAMGVCGGLFLFGGAMIAISLGLTMCGAKALIDYSNREVQRYAEQRKAAESPAPPTTKEKTNGDLREILP